MKDPKVFANTFLRIDGNKDDSRGNVKNFIDNTLGTFGNLVGCGLTTLDVELDKEKQPNYPEGLEDLKLDTHFEAVHPSIKNPEDIKNKQNQGLFTYNPLILLGSQFSLDEIVHQDENLIIGYSEKEDLNGETLKLRKDLIIGGEHLATILGYGINKTRFDQNPEFVLSFIDSYSRIMDSWIDFIFHTMMQREKRITEGKFLELAVKEDRKNQDKIAVEEKTPIKIKSNDEPGRGYTIPSKFNDFANMGFNPKMDLINGVDRYKNLGHNFKTIFGSDIDTFYKDKTDLSIILFNTMLIDLFCSANKINGDARENLLLVGSSALAPPYLFFLDSPEKQKDLFQDMARSTNLLAHFYEINYKGARAILSKMDNIIGNSEDPSVDFLELVRRYSVMVFPSRFEFGGVKEFMEEHTTKGALYHLPGLIVREMDRIKGGPRNYNRKEYGKGVLEFINKYLVPLVCEPGYDKRYKEDFLQHIRSSS